MDPRTRMAELAAHWHPPAGLERSSPRELKLKPAGIALVVIAVLMAAASLASGVLLHLKASADRETMRQLTASGQDADGRVLQRIASKSRDNRRYWIEYEYQVGGQPYKGRVEVGRAAWQEVYRNTPVPVRFLPSDPARHMVVGRAGSLMPLWVPYLVAAGLALGAWLLTRPLVSQRRLLAEGRPAPAIVTRHDKKTQHGVVAHFVFRLLNGSTAEGESGPHRKPPELDSTLCVLYLPDRPDRYAVYPLSMVRTVSGH